MSGPDGPRPAVSVVITVLNEALNIGPLIEDLLRQTLPAAELVIVDGGSTDGTLDQLQQLNQASVRTVSLPGSNISQGRNHGIDLAGSELIAVTDAGVRLGPDWLETIATPLQRGQADLVAGFFQSDPRSTFELALGATTLPAVQDVDPATFLPSSRSIAFKKSVWRAVGGYPEWLDYCEDLIFDLNVRSAGYAVHFAPLAAARFRPRSSLGAFMRQYYRYARGDGKANLWLRRHVARYASYATLTATLIAWASPAARREPAALRLLTLLVAAGCVAYLRRPVQRLIGAAGATPPTALALLPLIRLCGDLAKMAGYPTGWLWRLKNKPPEWRR